MTKTRFYWIATIGAVLGLFSQLFLLIPQWRFHYLSLPLAPIGLGLRQLSLSGGLGNGLAWGIYLLMVLIPLGFIVYKTRRSGFNAADSLLLGLSLFLFWGIYTIINPDHFWHQWHQQAGFEFSGLAINLSALSILAVYIGWSLVSNTRNADPKTLSQTLQYLILALGAFIAFNITGPLLQRSLQQIITLGTSDPGLISNIPEIQFQLDPQYRMSIMLIVGQYLIRAISWSLSLYLTAQAGQLIGAIQQDLYAESIDPMLKRFITTTKRFILYTLLSCSGFNILLLYLAKQTRQLDFELSFPIISILLLFLALLMARYLQAVRELKREHEMII